MRCCTSDEIWLQVALCVPKEHERKKERKRSEYWHRMEGSCEYIVTE